MKILITGSSGFVGNFLVSALTSQGHNVIGLDVVQYPFQHYKNYKFICCNISNRTEVNSIVKRESPSHIIHLAYIMIPKHIRAIEDSVDLLGSENIFLAANSTESVKQILLFSSASIYGGNPDNPAWISEEVIPRPGEWVYAQNKVLAEEFYLSYHKRDNLNVVIFRMCTACGPSYFQKKGLVRLLKNSPIGQLVNGTDMNMQFIHEDDVINLTTLILQDNEVEGVYNLAPDSYVSTKELSPNPKLFIKISEKRIKSIFNWIWKLRIAKISPTSTALITYSIVISPKKLMDRYNYQFKHTTLSAFHHSIGK